MNKRFSHTLALVLFLLLLSGGAWAADGSVYEMNPTNSGESAPLVTATLISDAQTVAPGDTFRIGVRYALLKKWHIYWKHPGSTGKPTKLKLSASQGVTIGDVQMPAPTFFPGPPGAGIWTNGYEKEVILFAKANVPSTAKPGETITIDAKSKWLACDENCLPENNATMKLAVTIGEKTAASEHLAAFDATAKRVPKPDDSIKIQTTVTPENPGPKTKWSYKAEFLDAQGRPLSKPTFTPGPSKGLSIKNVAVEPSQNGAIRLSMDGKTGKKGLRGAFGGVLGFDRDGVRHAVTVDLPFGKPSTKEPDCPEFDPANAEVVLPPATQGPVNLEPPKEIVELGATGEKEEESFLLMLLFAFLGGLILNIMPCVLPVLSIKIFSLLEQSGDDKKTIRNNGLVYTSGVLVCFAALSVPFMLTPQGWGFG